MDLQEKKIRTVQNMGAARNAVHNFIRKEKNAFIKKYKKGGKKKTVWHFFTKS